MDWATLVAQTTIAADDEGTGFIPGSRGSFMLDFVFAAMFGILLVMVASIYLVRVKKRYELHKKIQLILAAVLLIAVLGFEIDMRLFTDWEALAAPSRYYHPERLNPVVISLAIHLCFAIPTPVLWAWVIYEGLRKFPSPAAPGAHSRRHRFWGWMAAIGMLLTSITGWIFYVLAFVM